jgi:putative cell wall-binding protein
VRFIFAILALLLVPQAAFAEECTAVLSSDNRADFAAASVLALRNDFALVTTPWGRLSTDSIQGLEATGCGHVYVIGGTTAIPGAEEALAAAGMAVERLGGADRYETSAHVARTWKTSLIVFIASGRDGQGISDAVDRANAVGAPVIFIRDGEVPPSAGGAIASIRARDARLVPSPAMDTPAIDTALRGMGITDNHIAKIDKRERAENAIIEANAAISGAGQMLGDITKTNARAAHSLLEAAKGHVDAAHYAFENGDYGEAFGRATSAGENAENSRKISSGIIAGYLRNIVTEEMDGSTGPITDIVEISVNPFKYHGTKIKVKGEVQSDPVYIDKKTYIELQDKTGRIFVEKEGFAGPPVVNRGDSIEVTGSVKISPSYGGSHGTEHENLPTYIIEAEEIGQV